MEEDNKIPGVWLKWLEKEVADWRREGLVDENQARSILLRYEGVRSSQEREQGGKLVTVLAVIGALLLGIGVILFIASNWQAMSRELKVALVLGSIIVAYAVGYYLAFGKQNYPRVGRAVIFLGTIFYGAGIWLIAQIFHISSHFPNGVLFWAGGILPIVLICDSLSVLLESTLLLTLWTMMEQLEFGNYNWFYLPPIAIVFWLCYRMKARPAAGLALISGVIWTFITNVVAYNNEKGVFLAFLLIALMGILIYTVGNLQALKEKLSAMKLPYQIVGLLVFLFSLFILSFRWFNDLVNDWDIQFNSVYLTLYLSTALGMAAAGVLAVLKRADKGMLKEGIFALAMAAVIVILTFTASGLGGRVFLAVINIVLFVAVVALIVNGYTNREPVLINFGLVFFVMDVIARYFDFFWDMLDKSIFFMAGGLLLLVGGTLLERYRRKIIRGMKVNNYAA